MRSKAAACCPATRGRVCPVRRVRDDAGDRLTLYVSNEAPPEPAAAASVASRVVPASADTRAPDASATAFQFVRHGKVNVFYWVDGRFRYAITAASDRPTLSRVSEEVYRQLDTPGH